MPIPDYESLMLPVLKVAADGNEHRVRDVVSQIANQFALSDTERQQMLPKVRQTVIANRVHWAKTYLKQAGVLESPKRAFFRITPRGRKVLAENPTALDNTYLSQFEEFRQFRERTRSSVDRTSQRADEANQNRSTSSKTPEEMVLSTIEQIETSLRRDLLKAIMERTPDFFEALVVKLLLKMGFGGSREDAGQIIGRSGDGGLDGVIDQDALGLDRVYIQAKRWALDRPVSEPDVRGFSGSLGANKADKGVFVTTSSFTKSAVAFAERHPSRIVLIDGEELARLMIRYNIGARIDETLYLKKIDEDFFDNE